MDCEDCKKEARYKTISPDYKSAHHHCKTCDAWQFGTGETDTYGHGECYSCAVKRINKESAK